MGRQTSTITEEAKVLASHSICPNCPSPFALAMCLRFRTRLLITAVSMVSQPVETLVLPFPLLVVCRRRRLMMGTLANTV